jgi:hypothetical protein
VLFQKGVVFMKNSLKFIGIITLAVLIGFSLAVCPTDSGGDNGSSFLGDTLKLSGKVSLSTPSAGTEFS